MRVAAGLKPQARERVENDLGEIVVVADDEGEDTDIEGLLDQPSEHLLVGGERPEQAGQGDVDRDQHAGEPAHVALNETEARVDVLGEDAQEPIDNARAAHALVLHQARFSGTSARSGPDSPSRSSGSGRAAPWPGPGLRRCGRFPGSGHERSMP